MKGKSAKGLRKFVVYMLSFILLIGMLPVYTLALETIPFTVKVVVYDADENTENDIPIEKAKVIIGIMQDEELQEIISGETDKDGLFTGEIESVKIAQDYVIKIEHESYEILEKEYEALEDDIEKLDVLEAVKLKPVLDEPESEPELKETETESKEPEIESKETETESKEPETESKETETESKELETESKEPETESKETETESKETETESKETETESKELETESKEPETESKEPETESKELEPRQINELDESDEETAQTEESKEPEIEPPHEHEFNIWGYDNDSHWLTCACGSEVTEGKVSHDWIRVPDKDTDTKYAYTCKCGAEGASSKSKQVNETQEITETKESVKETQKPKTDSPATGDNANIELGMIVAIVSLITMSCMIILITKQKNKE